MSNQTGGTSVADSLRDARVAAKSAHYDAALEHLESCEDWPLSHAEDAIVLKADVLGRRDPVRALEYLTSVRDLAESPQGRFGMAIAFGKAHAAVRNFSQAESHYEEARALKDAAPHGIYTMAYHDLRMRWFRRECDPSAPEVELAIQHPDPSIASAAYAFRAWLHTGKDDYASHVADLRRAVEFAFVRAEEPVDVATLATSTHALTQVAFETADGESIAVARRAFEAIAWTPDVHVHHFLTVRAFGWNAFMRGKPAEAQWTFKDARGLARNAPARVMAHADRAYVARMSHNDYWAAEELAQADALAYDIRWESLYGEERQVLVMLAVLHAQTDAPRAQRYAAMYSQVGTENVDPGLAVHHDPRAVAHARYAQGRIDQTLGRREAAIAALKTAHETFVASSFHYRATLSATALAELTGDSSWRAVALEHANAYRDCPLATMADEAVTREDAMPAQLSPLQRQLARAVWAGADRIELSRRFSRSAHTIDRQVEAIMAAFGVASRSELLDEARRRELA